MSRCWTWLAIAGRPAAAPALPTAVPTPTAQVTIINSRLIALIAQTEDRWPLAGDQLVIDLDMSMDNLPTGTRISIGSAVIEISEEPHTGCSKFAQRFGHDALRFISTPTGQGHAPPRRKHPGRPVRPHPRRRPRNQTPALTYPPRALPFSATSCSLSSGAVSSAQDALAGLHVTAAVLSPYPSSNATK